MYTLTVPAGEAPPPAPVIKGPDGRRKVLGRWHREREAREAAAGDALPADQGIPLPRTLGDLNRMIAGEDAAPPPQPARRGTDSAIDAARQAQGEKRLISKIQFFCRIPAEAATKLIQLIDEKLHQQLIDKALRGMLTAADIRSILVRAPP
ncbi:MAG: hypothetical protein K2Q10_06920, partial [Rhodospirillales bacterium]|nr:hypothetical protein [Rhodospirillales bacterium]